MLVEQCYKCHSATRRRRRSSRAGCCSTRKAGLLKGGDTGPAIVPGKPGDGLLLQGAEVRRRRADAAEGEAARRRHRGLREVDRGRRGRPATATWRRSRRRHRHREGQAVLVVPAADEHAPPTSSTPRAPRRRSTASSPPKWAEKGLTPAAGADKRHADPPGVLRPHRPAADARGGRRVRRRRVARRLREAGRSAAGVAALRRALGAALARRGPLRRGPGPHLRREAEDAGLALPRLGHRGVQRRHALRPVREAADRRRPAARTTRSDAFTKFAGLGFLGLGAEYYKNTAADQAIAEELDDRVDTLTRGFLGLTVACARCHDHKFDPIPTKDYYSLAGHLHGHEPDRRPARAARRGEGLRRRPGRS